MYGYAYGLYLAPEIPMELLHRGGKEGLDRLSTAAGIGTGAPMTQNRAFLTDADHALEFQLDAFVGEYLPLTPPETHTIAPDDATTGSLLMSIMRSSQIQVG